MRVLCFSLALALAGCGGSSTTAPAPAPATAEPTEPASPVQLSSFDAVWQTVADRHWDLGGVDWQAVKSELRPKAMSAATNAELRPILQEMLARLGQSHFAIVPADAYAALEGDAPAAEDQAQDGGVGLTVRVLDDRALVTAVEPGSPAAEAGVKAGWIVASVDGEPVADGIAKVAEAYPDGASLRHILLARTTATKLVGPVGSAVTIGFLDGQEQAVERRLERTALPGKVVRFGHMPGIRVRYQSRRLGDDVGYVALSAFFDPASVMPSFAADVASFRGATLRGLVLDLRGNPGGIAAMAMGIGGHLVSDTGHSLGTMISKDGELELALTPQPDPFTGKVAVLVDAHSASTSEILAGGLQAIGRARVFGRRTAGAALPSNFERLPNGDGFQYAMANFVSASGQPLEGAGVTPDVVVELSREALLTGKDSTLDAALSWIHNSDKGTK